MLPAMPHRRVTIGDVAAEAGVSVATVSKVINDRYGVAAETSNRVKAVIDDLGYESSLIARSLRSHRTNVLGILVADIEPFSAELLKGAARAIKSSGYELIVYSGSGHGNEHAGWERRNVSRLSGTLTDGIILVTPTVDDVGRRRNDRCRRPAHRCLDHAQRPRRQPRRERSPRPSTSSASVIGASASLPVAPTSSRHGCVSRATTTPWPPPASTPIPSLGVSAGTSSRPPSSRRASCSNSPIHRRRSSLRTTSRRSRR